MDTVPQEPDTDTAVTGDGDDALLLWHQYRPVHLIVGKKRDPGILDPEPFLAQIRKVEARLGKLAKIRKVETD